VAQAAELLFVSENRNYRDAWRFRQRHTNNRFTYPNTKQIKWSKSNEDIEVQTTYQKVDISWVWW
jgi:hypothetical protein